MSMALECKNCGIRIRWRPTVVDGQAYCCVGCSHGGPCTCDYENLPLGEMTLVHQRSQVMFSMVKVSHLVRRQG